MTYEAVDVLSAVDKVVTAEKKRAANRSAEASPLLHAMRTDGFGSIPDFPSRTGSAHSQAQSTVLERIAEMAERSAVRNLSPTLSADLPSQAPSRRASVDSTNSRATDRSHILHGFPQAYRDAFSGVPSVYAEYARPLSRASSRSGYYPQYRYGGSPTGAGSPVQASRSTRVHRQQMLAELTDSSDEGSPGKRRGRRSTRNVLRSLDLRASDMGWSSDDSPSPRGKAPQMTKIARAKASQDPHIATSSTEEDRNRRRAWEEGGAVSDHRVSSSPAEHRADWEPSPNSRAQFNDSGSGSETEGGAGSESVLHSALSVVRGLEQRSRRSKSVDIDEVQDVEDYLAKSRGLTRSQRSSASPDTPEHRTTRAAVAPAVQDMLEMAFQSAKGSPKLPSSSLLSASRSPAGKSPQVFSGRKDGKNFIFQTVPAYGPAADLQDSIGLPVYRVTGKYNLPMEQRSWGFRKVCAEDCFDNYSWWKDKAVKRRSARKHGVYVEEPHLLPETLSASMTEQEKFGTHSQFDRSKYKTADRRMLGPKFDEYSPHLPTKSNLEKLPLEYRKMIAMKSKERPGIRKSYIDEVLRRGTATRDKHRASTWDSVQSFFHNQASAQSNDIRRIDTHPYT